MTGLLKLLVALPFAVPTLAQGQTPLPTGKSITPRGAQTPVGSFPANMLAVLGGRYVVVSNAGFRQKLTVISTETGRAVSSIELGATKDGVKEGLYYGLALGSTSAGQATIWASRGSEERVAGYTVDAGGHISDAGLSVQVPRNGGGSAPRNTVAGIAFSADGSTLYAAANNTTRQAGWKGAVSVLDVASGRHVGTVAVGGFPYAVAALTTGPDADKKVYVTSERDGVVSVVEPVALRVAREIRVGATPTALLLDGAQRRLFVANAGSDTVSVIDTRDDRLTATILLRPDGARGLPGATPMGMALSPDEARLYVALADMNAVAVVDVAGARLSGYVPVGWYPTAVAVSPDGRRLLVANAKGAQVRNPNARPVGPDGSWGQYVPNIIEGTVSIESVPRDAELGQATKQVLANNRIGQARKPLKNPGIKHVFYIIKENRTYDQVFGDLTQGNGDPSVCLFPRDVTPNHHALAERFGLFDNFHCCAEVSADGWNWSVSGMANEYTVRNSMYSYSGRGRSYDYEGLNNGSPVDLQGLTDVAAAPGGYLWDLCLRGGVSFRNYGFFVTRIGAEEKDPAGRALTSPNAANKRALQGRTDESFLQFDMSYADSEAWVAHGCQAPRQMRTFGKRGATSRFAEWKAEFDEYVRRRNLPRLNMIRLPRDHTQGTAVGFSSPRAMVADNDYALGQVVEAISSSPYWSTSAIVVIEDDAQAGHDHVDAHRSVALVISPFSKRGAVDSRFYNTDSALRTMEILLGLPPMCQYDAVAPPFDCFTAKRDNAEPYRAILPARSIVAEVNTATAFRSDLSARLDFARADAVPDALLNHILWHAIRGESVPEPPSRYGLRLEANTDGD